MIRSKFESELARKVYRLFIVATMNGVIAKIACSSRPKRKLIDNSEWRLEH